MSDLLLGFPGVVAMLALWNAATGFVWLPLMRNGDTWHAWPGVFVALALLLFAHGGALLGLVAFAMSSVIMAPAMRFAPKRARTNWVLGSTFLALAATSFVIGRTSVQGVTLLQVVVEVILLPIGIVLAGVAMSRGRAQFAPIAASVLFVAAWTVWMTRDYYYTSAQ